MKKILVLLFILYYSWNVKELIESDFLEILSKHAMYYLDICNEMCTKLPGIVRIKIVIISMTKIIFLRKILG